MNGTEVLTTIAQLAVAVAGFSGIAIAFNRQPGRLSEFEAFRVSILFANGLAAMFLSLIPFALFYLKWSDFRIWRASSALIVLFELAFLSIQFRATVKFLRSHRDMFNMPLVAFLGIGHACNAVLQVFGALGWNG